jgi:hypothetical protein
MGIAVWNHIWVFCSTGHQVCFCVHIYCFFAIVL